MSFIGLAPVGSAVLQNNFDSFVLREAEREAIDEIAEPDLLELIRDYFLQTRFDSQISWLRSRGFRLHHAAQCNRQVGRHPAHGLAECG